MNSYLYALYYHCWLCLENKGSQLKLYVWQENSWHSIEFPETPLTVWDPNDNKIYCYFIEDGKFYRAFIHHASKHQVDILESYHWQKTPFATLKHTDRILSIPQLTNPIEPKELRPPSLYSDPKILYELAIELYPALSGDMSFKTIADFHAYFVIQLFKNPLLLGILSGEALHAIVINSSKTQYFIDSFNEKYYYATEEKNTAITTFEELREIVLLYFVYRNALLKFEHYKKTLNDLPDNLSYSIHFIKAINDSKNAEELIKSLTTEHARISKNALECLKELKTYISKVKIISSQLDYSHTKKESPFDYDIIIDFENSKKLYPSLIDFSQKYIKPMKIMSAKKFFELTEKNDFESPFKESGKKIRIYLVGHCFPNEKFLSSVYLYIAIAKSLAKYIGSQQNEVLVDLAACYAGRGKNANDVYHSLAARLHRKLFGYCKRDIPVVARNLAVTLNSKQTTKYKDGVEKSEFHKTTYNREISYQEIENHFNKIDSLPKKSDAQRLLMNERAYKYDVWHQPGSKILFKMHNNKQHCLDAYYYTFKSKALKTVKETIKHTLKKDKISLLKEWQEVFSKMQNEEIYTIIETELQKVNSVIKKHSNPLSFFWNTNAHNKFKALLEERERFKTHANATIEVKKN